jgi:hypothetical protein
VPETVKLDVISDPSVVADFHLPRIGNGHDGRMSTPEPTLAPNALRTTRLQPYMNWGELCTSSDWQSHQNWTNNADRPRNPRGSWNVRRS